MAISGAAAAFAAIGGSLAGISGWTLVAYAALAGAATYASQSMARRAAEKSQRLASTPGATTASFRNPAAPRQIIYGKTRVGGPLAYLASTPGGNGEVLMTVLLASHECTAIDEVWLDDYQVTLTGPTTILRGYRSHYEWTEIADPMNPGGTIPSQVEVVDDAGTNVSVYYDNGRYKVTRERDFYGFLCERSNLGTASQTASTLLTSASGGAWTSNHRLRGICHLPILFAWMPDMFPSGVPNPSAVVRGKKLYDPRKDSTNGGSGSHRVNTSSTWEYSNNSALCLLDYLLDARLGLGAASTEIDFASFITAANACDQSVSVAGGGTEARYTCNGILTTEASHENNILSILSSMDGRLVYSGGKFRCYPGVYTAPTVTLTDDDLAGPVEIQTQQERSRVYNAARGEFASSATKWQRSDYPPYQDSTAYADDQNEWLWADLPLPLTTSASTAQRLAKLLVKRSRKQIVVNAPWKLTAMQVMAGETVALTMARYGWTSKPFTVEDWRLNFSSDDPPQITVSMTLREIDEATFAWTSAEQSTFASSPATDLPDPFTVTAPADLTLNTTTSVQTDGTIVTKIRALFSQSTDPYVTGGGQVVMQWKVSTATTWGAQQMGLGNAFELYSDPVQSGATYNVRLRFENASGVPSEWTTGSITLGGDLVAPGAVTSLSAAAGIGSIRLAWTNPSDDDLAYVEIWEHTSDVRASATRVANIAGSSFSRTGLATGQTRYYWVRAVDTSGNLGAWNATAGVSATVVSVSAADISVSTLAAITADLGAVTAGSIDIGTATQGLEVNVSGKSNAVYIYQNSQTVYGLYCENNHATANGGGAASVRSTYGYTLEALLAGDTSTQDYAAISAAATATGGGNVRIALPAGKGGYAGYANSGTWSPFTGSHDGLIAKETDIEPGDIVVDGTVLARKISDTITVVHRSDMPSQPAIGVYVSQFPLSVESPPAALRGSEEVEPLADLYDVAVINAVGEGSINVCGEGGDLAAGDLIVTSSTPGKGMRQSDNVVRSTTVARAREAVTFTAAGEACLVACIYLCG